MVAPQKPHHENERVISTVVQRLELQLLKQPDKCFQGGDVEVKLVLRIHHLQEIVSAPPHSVCFE